MVLREVEQRLRVADRIAACMVDPRAPGQITHGLADIIGFRLLMIAAGYEDGNDADTLRSDPMFKMALARAGSRPPDAPDGLQGIVRGKSVRTTISDKTAPCPLDRVNRDFKAPAPNRLWVSDFTYVATWCGFVYVAFVIDAYARRIVGWRVSRTAEASFVLDALEQAIHARRPAQGGGLIHHSDRGSQYLSIRYTERLAEAGIAPSVGSVGDSYDNALAETVIGLFKTEVIRRAGPWRSIEAVEFATLEWVDWFNNRRLLEPIGNIPPAEAEASYYAELETRAVAA